MKAFSHSYCRLKSHSVLALEEETLCFYYLWALLKLQICSLLCVLKTTSHSSINNNGIMIKRWALRSFRRKYLVEGGIYIWEKEFSLTCQHD